MRGFAEVQSEIRMPIDGWDTKKKHGLIHRRSPSRQSPVGLAGRLGADHVAAIRKSGGDGGSQCFGRDVFH